MARAKSDRSEGRLGLVFLIVLAIILLFVGRDAAKERRATPTLTADIQAPIASFLGRPFRAIEMSLNIREDRRRALEENRVLRRELIATRREIDRLAAMQTRLARLESTLNIRVNGDIPQDKIIARVVSDPGSPFVRSFLLSAGAEDGIRQGWAVVSDAGLVGHILSVGKRSARILRLDDLNSRIAVMSERTGARAILSGSNEGMPTLKFIADAEGWDVGDQVVTSGDGGQLPQGLLIGEVIEPGKVALAYQAEPVDWVAVLPFDHMVDDQDVEGLGEDEQGTLSNQNAGTDAEAEAG